MTSKHWRRALPLLAAALWLASSLPVTATVPQHAAASAAMPFTVQHQLGSTVISRIPQRVAVLDMNEADYLDRLGVPIAGMPKDYVPHFLAKYRYAANVIDLGAIVQPNLEQVYALQPDLVLISPLQAMHYAELSQIAPTLHLDVDFRSSQAGHIDSVRQHLLLLGRVFGKSVQARQQLAQLDARLQAVRSTTRGRPERALIVMHNNGAFSNFGINSRYGFVFGGFGVQPAGTAAAASMHGLPISSEFIRQADPDILLVIDRTAVMTRQPVSDAVRLGNPLLRQTKAWKSGRVVFVDADAWYTTAASVTSLQIMINDVLKAYRR